MDILSPVAAIAQTQTRIDTVWIAAPAKAAAQPEAGVGPGVGGPLLNAAALRAVNSSIEGHSTQAALGWKVAAIAESVAGLANLLTLHLSRQVAASLTDSRAHLAVGLLADLQDLGQSRGRRHLFTLLP